jgi:hypothetical protein
MTDWPNAAVQKSQGLLVLSQAGLGLLQVLTRPAHGGWFCPISLSSHIIEIVVIFITIWLFNIAMENPHV